MLERTERSHDGDAETPRLGGESWEERLRGAPSRVGVCIGGMDLSEIIVPSSDNVSSNEDVEAICKRCKRAPSAEELGRKKS